MTTIDPSTLKPGDRIRYQREATVKGNFDGYLSLKAERGNGRPAEFRLGYEGWVPTTFELLERPLPDEPPIGSVVVFHHAFGSLDAWKRWGDHLGWLHAGNSTPSRRPGDADRIQGHTWAELLEDRLDIKRTVIQP